MSDPSGTPLKPQDTIIFLLGEMKGELRALREGQAAAVVTHAASDVANLKEHEEFRAVLGGLTSDVAVLNDSRAQNRLNVSDRIQKWMVWLALPACLGAVIYLGTLVINKP